MKEYSIPTMNISAFERENIMTQSGIDGHQAFEEAKQTVRSHIESQELQQIFTIKFF
ncbi:MAG: hypothetical protein IJH37_05285 [Clostridia bacterium]|nr:hypothetical protein [Clostridia bacterium]